MILSKADKETKLVIVNCNCGCEEEIHIKKFIEGREEYYLSIYTGKFDALQDGIFRTICRRLKAIWKIIRGKEYLLTEIVLTKEEFETLKSELKEM